MCMQDRNIYLYIKFEIFIFFFQDSWQVNFDP